MWKFVFGAVQHLYATWISNSFAMELQRLNLFAGGDREIARQQSGKDHIQTRRELLLGVIFRVNYLRA